jgi:hypothetical protein
MSSGLQEMVGWAVLVLALGCTLQRCAHYDMWLQCLKTSAPAACTDLKP